MNFARILLLIALNSLTPLTSVAQHVHGVVELGVVVEDATVAVSLTAPLSDVVGFEHAPESEEQETLIMEAATMLAVADAMFGFPESAQCELSSLDIDGPGYVTQHVAEEGDHDEDHHDHDHDHEDHDGHDHHDDHEEHAEVIGTYEWTCGDVSAIDSLDLLFTKGFANIDSINVQILTSAGARVLTLEGRVSSISL